MASPRPAAAQKKKETKEPFSSNTRDKAQAAKDYIEKKYSKLKKNEQERQEDWEELKRTMEELNLSSTEQDLIKQKIMRREAEIMRQRRQKVSVFDFEPVKIIGKGAFGEVRVVRYKPTGEVFAMKKLNKTEMLYKNQVQHVKAERNVLATVENPWIVELKFSFQDDKNLYLVMEYLGGGDLMTLLIRKNILSEAESRFYIAECVLAIESIHKMNYIHRDIKPDNILIDNLGHIKISDFGLSKMAEISPKVEVLDKLEEDSRHKQRIEQRAEFRRNRKLAYSTVGTPDYIAPEVFSRTGYSETVDWWSIGVILYEMLVGYPPFYAEKPADICHKILSWQKYFTIPRDARLSSQAADLIRRLVCEAPIRLGSGGAQEIKSHPFFNGVDWNNIRNSTAPYIPSLASEVDTSNFDNFEETEPFYPPQTKKRSRKDPHFVGYTFKRDVELQRNGLVAAKEELEEVKSSMMRNEKYIPASEDLYSN
jgi:serine/threonine kinase 38